MTVYAPVPAGAEIPRAGGPRLDHERLEVYRVAVEFHALAMSLVPRRGCRALRDQLERSSSSVALLIAEGAGRTSAPDKRRFYELAKGSATESAAALDLLQRRGVLELGRYAQARPLLVRIVQMLSRLAAPPR